MALSQLVVGQPPPILLVPTVLFVFAQPLLLLRVVARVRPFRPHRLRWFGLAYGVAIVVLAALGSAARSVTSIGLVALFVAVEAAAAVELAREASRRRAAARGRFRVAALGVVALAGSILAAGVAAVVPGLGGATAGAQLLALAAAVAFVGAFLPPPWLRRVWLAGTGFDFLRELAAASPTESEDRLWQRLATAAETVSSEACVVILGSPDGEAAVAAASPAGIARDQRFPPGSLAELLEPARGGATAVPAADGVIVRSLAAATGADATTVVPVDAGPDRLGAVVVLPRGQSLFASDDASLVAAMAAQVSALVERRAVLAAQERLSAELAGTVAALEAAGRAKSDFLASMSHELRTPLNSIIGFSELMVMEPAEDGLARVPSEWLDHVLSSGQHLLGLINDVLDLSKVEAGRLDLAPEPVDLDRAAADVLDGLRPLAERKAVRLEARAGGATILVDRGRLRQILYNLLSNAIKYTPEGGSVTLTTAVEGEGARIAVRDTGVGIAPEDHERIFEEFSQVGDAALRQSGTGLGLALTRRLVEAHGGRIELESALGAGSTFSVILPGVVRAAAPAEPAAPAPAPERPDAPEILVIEDDAGAVRLLREYLEADGYRVRAARDGEAGLAAARQSSPAAIVLDVLLPGIDGWDVLRALKADDELRSIPVVIVTVVDEREVGLALGAVDYFVKPVDREALLATLARCVPDAPAGRSLCVLAIDDDPASLDLVASTLESAGHVVRRASSGSSGLEIARSEPVDAVVCDLVMPDVDGFEVVRALRADERTRSLPVLILTGRSLSEADKQRLRGGIAGIVEKGDAAVSGLRAWLASVAAPGRRRTADSGSAEA